MNRKELSERLRMFSEGRHTGTLLTFFLIWSEGYSLTQATACVTRISEKFAPVRKIIEAEHALRRTSP